MRNINRILSLSAVFMAVLICVAEVSAAKLGTGRSRVSMNVGEFRSLTSEVSCMIYYTQSSDPCSLSIEGPSEMIRYVKARVNDGRLVLTAEQEFYRGRENMSAEDVAVKISAPSLDYIDITGVGGFKSESAKFDQLEVNVTGVGSVEFENASVNNLTVTMRGTGDASFNGLRGENATFILGGVGNITLEKGDIVSVSAVLNGVGNMTLAGKAVNAVLTNGGIGSLDASSLRGTSVNARASGMGGITCRAVTSIIASADYGGSVVYYGDPKDITVTGNVERGGK